MTKDKKPESLDEGALDQAQGGLLQFEIQMAKKTGGLRRDQGDSLVEKPGPHRMERVHEDE
ncbi:MAG: hypothetical protein AAFR17_02000 [Pseudomonadota bacterium]